MSEFGDGAASLHLGDISMHPSNMSMLKALLAALFALTVAADCTSRTSDSQSAEGIRKAIEAEIARSLDATRRQDITAFMERFTPDFAIAANDGDAGSLTDLRAHTLRDWAIIPATRDLWMRIDSMSTHGDSAVVFTSQQWDRLMLERDGITRDTVVTTQKHREVWRRTAAGWRSAHVKELGGTVSVNGKPYP